MKRFVLVLALALLILSTVSAFTISVPSQVEVHDSNSFLVEITNPTNQTQDLQINFFSTINANVYAPDSISPHSNISARVVLDYSPPIYEEINTTLEVYLGNDLEKREILLIIYPSQNPTTMNNTDEGYLGALFGFGSVGEMFSFSVLEWALFIVLVIIAAILLVALVVRVIKREK